MQQALYRKYRPGKFADLVGQEPIKLTLANQVKASAVGHAYIFAGPKGTGKTTVARILAKAVNCLDLQDGDPCGKCALCMAADEGVMLDLIEIDAASNNSVDNVRELIDRIYISPAMGKYKVYIIDEAHMLSKPAFNALLKTLEEPPAHAMFILATTEIEKFPATIVSRCQRFDFRPIKLAEVSEYLTKVAKQENIDIDAKGIELIAEQSGGGMRDALSFLERAMAMGTAVNAESLAAWFGIVGWSELLRLSELVVDGARTEALAVIDTAYRNGYDLTRLASGWTNVVRSLLAAKLGNAEDLGLVAESTKRLTDLADRLTYDQTVWWLEQMLELAFKVKTSAIPQLPLELMVLKMIEKVGNKDQGTDNKDGGVGSPTKVRETPMPPRDESPVVADSTAMAEAVNSDTTSPVVAESIVSNSVEVSDKPAGKPLDLDWDRFIVEAKKKSPTLGAALQNSRQEMEGDILVIRLASRFYKEKFEQPTSREMVAGALAECGVELRVEYRLDEANQVDKASVDPRLVSELFG